MFITTGLNDLGQPFVRDAVDAVRSFESFTAENDPWGR